MEQLTGSSHVKSKTDTGSPLLAHEPDKEKTEAADDPPTVEEPGKSIRKSRSTIYKLVSAKKIPCVKVGRSDVCRHGDLKKWLQEQPRSSI